MSNQRWTDQAAIEQWEAIPRDVLDAMVDDGDLAKRHLINPQVLRMLGELSGKRVLDAGCGNGYFSRLLADGGAEVVRCWPSSSAASPTASPTGSGPPSPPEALRVDRPIDGPDV